MAEAPASLQTALDALPDTPTADQVYAAGRSFTARELAAQAYAAAQAAGGGGGGGPTELAYAETNTAELDLTNAEQVVIETGNITFDGATRVCVEYFSPLAHYDSCQIEFRLRKNPGAGITDPNNLGSIGMFRASTDVGQSIVSARRYYTPAAGTYKLGVTAHVSNGPEQALLIAGDGGPGNYMPGFIRVTTA